MLIKSLLHSSKNYSSKNKKQNKFIENWKNHQLGGNIIYFNGIGPHENSDLIDLLPPGITGLDLGTIMSKQKVDYTDPRPACMILGLVEADKNQISQYVEALQPKVTFLPQEGFIDLLIGYSWWTREWVHILDAMLNRHPPLAYVKELADDYADDTAIEWWPVDLPESTSSGDSEFTKESPLKSKYGYSIRDARGKKVSNSKRQQSLRDAYEDRYPLQDIVAHIHSQINVRQRQRNGAQTYRYAISCWKMDLGWLKRKLKHCDSL